MARTKPLEEDEPLTFARGILGTIIAKHDPESIKGKDAKKVAAGLSGGSKGGRIRAQNLSTQKRKRIARKAANTRWNKKESTKS
jgi:hypothetical protein